MSYKNIDLVETSLKLATGTLNCQGILEDVGDEMSFIKVTAWM